LPEHLPLELRSESVPSAPGPGTPSTGPAAAPTDAAAGEGRNSLQTLEEVEIAHIRRVLAMCGGNRTLAAQHLGITRQTLSRRLEEAERTPSREPDRSPGRESEKE
jgi:DNA-binding NtrC family response regulator